MTTHEIVSKGEWVEARTRLLAKEKEFTHIRDELSAERRTLPWVRIDKNYTFDGPNGRETLAQLFGDRSQLVVYHFMFAPEWEVGCKSCSFWADNFNGITAHLRARDVAFAAISRAPVAKLQAFAKRLGWTFKWVSSGDTDFNYDFDVSFRPEDLASGNATYNFATMSSFRSHGSAFKNFAPSDMPGVSVFAKDESGAVFRTYSSYGRGIDMMNTAYHYLNVVPKGRDEGDQPGHQMAWVKLRDLYDR
ncbi:MAG: thioredoxin family protein [Betaproteobacteria bacterium]